MKLFTFIISLVVSMQVLAGPGQDTDLTSMIQKSEQQSEMIQSKLNKHLKLNEKPNLQAESLIRRIAPAQPIDAPAPILQKRLAPQRESLEIEKKNSDRFSLEIEQ